MLTNSVLSIYNKFHNPETNQDEWKFQFIGAANWFEEVKSQLVDNNISRMSSNVKVGRIVKIRVPLSSLKNYVSPEKWDGEGWTVQEGALVVRCDAPEKIERPSDLDKMGIPYATVNAWTDNRVGSPYVQHIKLVAV